MEWRTWGTGSIGSIGFYRIFRIFDRVLFRTGWIHWVLLRCIASLVGFTFTWIRPTGNVEGLTTEPNPKDENAS